MNSVTDSGAASKQADYRSDKTPGIVLIKVRAQRVHYWDGEDSGDVKLPN